MCAMVPLYFAMLGAYGLVKWWKIFTPEECSSINRFVAVFVVPVGLLFRVGEMLQHSSSYPTVYVVRPRFNIIILHWNCASNLSGAEIYSVNTRTPPREFNHGNTDLAFCNADLAFG
uniref:Uncharacterized protein n=1 Tax=Nelumbo nucifera TaxID=4432 RepID=A0A822XPE3_NELNU|nr:TPA_asm: hypothetical protein HUJ06_023016 [Nelumbo nucifera]